MTAIPDSVSKKECLIILAVCLLVLVVPSAMTHIRMENHEEDHGKRNESDARYLSGKHGFSQWTKYILQYKNPEDFLYPKEQNGFSFFRYRQNDDVLDMLPHYTPVVELSFARQGMKEQPPQIVMPDFPLPESYTMAPVPVYPQLPTVQYPAVFASDGQYLGHLDITPGELKNLPPSVSFTVATPVVAGLPRCAYLETPSDDTQMNQKLIALVNQKLMSPDFMFNGEKLTVFFTPVTGKKEGEKP